MLLVVAIGGNALLERGEKPDADIQLAHIEQAAPALALLARDHELVLCHGNGPQVGMLSLESEADRSLKHPYPLDVLGAQTQGMIGYWLALALRNAGVTKSILGVITQVEVDRDDDAFSRPSKFVGQVYSAETAADLTRLHGWTLARDGAQWRRVVPSPEPRRIVEQEMISALSRTGGNVLICGGGGGAPIAVDRDGRFEGVQAVVDKDLTASLLARKVDADRLILLTDVAAVQSDFGLPSARNLENIHLTELSGMSFPAGSMGPKIEACRRFVAQTGRPAAIGRLSDAAAVVKGVAGTTILP